MRELGEPSVQGAKRVVGRGRRPLGAGGLSAQRGE
jgi:hypothetical protein